MCLVKAMVFPVVMYGCESWTIKRDEHWRIDAFELWYWKRVLRIPWTARRSNQSILKEISSECSLEGLMLKLKLWPPDVKNWLTGKDPDARKDWRQEEKGMTGDAIVGWYHWLTGHEFGKLQELVMDREVWHVAVLGVTKSWTRLRDWWVFTGRTDAEAETPVLWPPHTKSWLIGKDPEAGRDWGQEEKGMTEDEMAGWHHWLDGHEFEKTPGVGDRQGGLACCGSWGCKESDMAERLNWGTELNQ